MKHIILTLALIFAAQAASAQYGLPVSFEPPAVNVFTDFGGAISEAVADPTNASNTVVRTIKPGGAEGWAGTTLGAGNGAPSFTGGLPFSATSTRMTVRVWSPIANARVLLKVETAGNPDVFVETDAFTTVAAGWQTLTFDFANPRPNDKPLNFGATYNVVSIFFNFLADGGAAGDLTFYWDDVAFADGSTLGEPGPPASKVAFPVTFEDDLDWDAIFTGFDGGSATVIDNPDKSGINTSNRVARFIKGAGAVWAGAFFDINTTLNLNMVAGATAHVWSPRANATVTLKLEVSTNGDQFFELTRPIGAANTWTEVTFDLSTANKTFNYDRITVIFDLGTAGDGSANYTFYLDNILPVLGETQGPAKAAFPVTFQENADWSTLFTGFDGGAASVIDNPDPSGANTSSKVGRMVKGAGQPWGGAFFDIVGRVDLNFSTNVTIKVWSPRAGVPFLLKLENSANNAQFFEIIQNIPVANAWAEMTYNFSAANKAHTYDRIVVIFDMGTVGDGSANFTFYFDDINNGITTSIDQPGTEVPTGLVLLPNYPNPFNPTTQIRYEMPISGEVMLEVFTLTGQRVATLQNGMVSAGSHEVRFDAGNLANGIYLVRLQGAGFSQTQKITLLK
jgi:hypothetical protein